MIYTPMKLRSRFMIVLLLTTVFSSGSLMLGMPKQVSAGSVSQMFASGDQMSTAHEAPMSVPSPCKEVICVVQLGNCETHCVSSSTQQASTDAIVSTHFERIPLCEVFFWSIERQTDERRGCDGSISASPVLELIRSVVKRE